MSEDEGDEEYPGLGKLDEGIGKLRDFLGTLADETVLDEEKLAFKRLLEEILSQMELTQFSAQFWADGMLESMRAGWSRVRELALAAGEKWDGFVDMANEMLSLIAEQEGKPRWEMKSGLSVAEVRRMLRLGRSAITRANNLLDMFDHMRNMDGYQPNIEHEYQENTIRASRDKMLDIEKGIVLNLQERGERVPVWRRRPEVDVAGPEVES